MSKVLDFFLLFSVLGIAIVLIKLTMVLSRYTCHQKF